MNYNKINCKNINTNCDTSCNCNCNTDVMMITIILPFLMIIISICNSILITNKLRFLSSSSINRISPISLTSLSSFNDIDNGNVNDNNGGGNEFNLLISSQLQLATKILNCSKISLYFTNSDSDSNYDDDNNNDKNQLTLIYSYPTNNINDYIDDDYDYNYNSHLKRLSLPLYLESKVIGKLDIEDYNNSNDDYIDIIINGISNSIAMEAKRLSLTSSLSLLKEQYNEMQYLHTNCLLTTNTLGNNHNYHYNN